MSKNRSDIVGARGSVFLGRDRDLRRMMGALTKSVPDNLSVVGPRFVGKTVMLTELAARLRQAGTPYSAILIWDLGHQTPENDKTFLRRFALELSVALKDTQSEFAELFKTSTTYQEIATVLSDLELAGVKVLAIMDGFDKPLSSGHFTRNLWDQLRELAQSPSLRLVTASRRTLANLIRHPDVQTSDFWNIFNPTPIRVGCFDENDLMAVFPTMPELQMSTGARTELWNASNGFPLFVVGILDAVRELGISGPVSPEDIKTACDAAFPAFQDRLEALWSDCPNSSQDLMRRVLEEKTVSRVGIAPADAETLIERGFVHSAANKLQRPSRLLDRYLQEQPGEGNALIRLFGAPDAYQKNLKGVLERRLSHLTGIDPTLKRYLERGIEDMPDHPDVFLSQCRGIVNQAFELIWRYEVPDRRIPSEWMAIWKHNRERRIEDFETTFPTGGARLRLLDYMTGTTASAPCARYVTKGTYLLMDAVQTFGDFGQHQEGAPIDSGLAYSVLHLCVEIAAALTRELPNAP